VPNLRLVYRENFCCQKLLSDVCLMLVNIFQRNNVCSESKELENDKSRQKTDLVCNFISFALISKLFSKLSRTFYCLINHAENTCKTACIH